MGYRSTALPTRRERCDLWPETTRKQLFGIGLFGASMLAAGVLPLATAYSVSEALGFEKGVSRSFREAPTFIGIFTFLVAVGAAIAVIPNLPLIKVLLVTQVINGLLLPVVLFAILRLINNRELMGTHVNGPPLQHWGVANRNYRDRYSLCCWFWRHFSHVSSALDFARCFETAPVYSRQRAQTVIKEIGVIKLLFSTLASRTLTPS